MFRFVIVWLLILDFKICYGADPSDYRMALRRAKYLLNLRLASSDELDSVSDLSSYQAKIRSYLSDDQFYFSVLRYHQKLLGVGLPDDYIEELVSDNIDGQSQKVASITCGKNNGANARFRCYWSSQSSSGGTSSCSENEEQAAAVFWYPKMVAWVCPSIPQTCGGDLSRCFIKAQDENAAKNSEFGVTETFDTKIAVIKSLGLQPAGLATQIVIENYPYKKILEPGLSAVDGALLHFYRQTHHFKIDDLHVSKEFLELTKQVSSRSQKFVLVKESGSPYEGGGLLSSFGWLRRYEKNRTRANQLYERLLCRKFTAELPRVFPQDPGNLRETPGCSGCHATLDPMADFFRVWGEGGDIYQGQSGALDTTFAGKSGRNLADLSRIVADDLAFASCTVHKVWHWLMGRPLSEEESELRAALSEYFLGTNYSFTELVFAIITHPIFLTAKRSDGSVASPLEDPPLGTKPGEIDRDCEKTFSFEDIKPYLKLCTGCHNSRSSPRSDLSSEEGYKKWLKTSLSMMKSGQMPQGNPNPPELSSMIHATKCFGETL